MEQKFNINEVPVEQIPDHSHVKQKFIDTLSALHKYSKEDAESIYEKERIYFIKSLNDPTRRLKECTKITLFSAFIEIAIQNLSIQDGSKSEAYIEARSVNIGTKDNKKWEQVARFVITTYGELNLRMRAGQIIRMSNPIVLYEGDHFQPRTDGRGILYVEYTPKIPRQSNNIIGSWVAVHLPHGLIDFKWLLNDDIERLKKYSIPKGRENATANALYSSNGNQIDPGFLETKTIKHAMRAYTKLRLAGNAVIEQEEFESEDDFVQPTGTRAEEKANATVVVQQEQNEEIF